MAYLLVAHICLQVAVCESLFYAVKYHFKRNHPEYFLSAVMQQWKSKEDWFVDLEV